MNAVFWLILFVMLLVVEFVTMGLATIWFAGGALIAFIVALLADVLWLEIAVFCVGSFVLLFATRPLAVKWLNQDRAKTNVDNTIGKTAVVTKTIRNLHGEGEALLEGMTWTARTESDTAVVETGKLVKVLRVSGVKLIVEELPEEGQQETPAQDVPENKE